MKKPRMGRPPIYSDKVAAIKAGKTLYFADAKMRSVTSVVSRIAAKNGWIFRNRTQDGGVIVWRLK